MTPEAKALPVSQVNALKYAFADGDVGFVPPILKIMLTSDAAGA